MPGARSRTFRIYAAVPCLECGAAAGEKCRNPIPRQLRPGEIDDRPQPVRPHKVRRLAWIEWKQQQGLI